VPEAAALSRRSGGLRGVSESSNQEPGMSGAPSVIPYTRLLALQAVRAETTPNEGAMANAPHDDQLLDAKIGKAAAETDTKIARMEGSINTALATIASKIDNLSGQVAERGRDKNLIIGTIVVAAIALGGMLWGMASYGDALFGRGMSVRDVVQAVIKEQQAQAIHPPSPKN
jgi:hypothetical protein